MTCFRPLPGDLISQLVTSLLESQRLKLFPSPSRGSYFSIFYNISTERGFSDCFRPLPGDLISQLFWLKKPLKKISRVSVPFPGILFLNNTDDKTSIRYGLRFRPLPGDLISQFANNDLLVIEVEVSVPFPGILFLNPVLYMPDLNWIPKPNCGAKPNPTLE